MTAKELSYKDLERVYDPLLITENRHILFLQYFSHFRQFACQCSVFLQGTYVALKLRVSPGIAEEKLWVNNDFVQHSGIYLILNTSNFCRRWIAFLKCIELGTDLPPLSIQDIQF